MLGHGVVSAYTTGSWLSMFEVGGAMGRRRALAVGAGSIMDLSGRATARTLRSGTRQRSDTASDWQTVGQSVRKAAQRVSAELSPLSSERRKGE